MQVVGYRTPEGALLVSDRDGDRTGEGRDTRVPVEEIPLEPGRRLDWRLGDRRCAGAMDDGGHVACEESAAPYCDAHRSTWVCARCTGTCLKDEMDCHQPHAVYLAAFAPATFKVGVTRRERLETRLREQGADRAVHLTTLPDGRVARELEAAIAADGLAAADRVDAAADERGSPGAGGGIPDRVRVPTKVEGLAAAVDETAWDRLLAGVDYEAEFEFAYGLDLAERPVAETLATGEVLGTKGRLLVLARGGSTYAVDMRELVGYELHEGGTDRRLQSSLGAFG